MRAVLWSDYICPWCYVGRDRTALIRAHGIEVDHRAFDLHPETPPGGVDVRPGGRLHAVLRRIGEECHELGMPFALPTHLPRSRRALETAELVRARHPRAFEALDDALFRAVFVDGIDIADRDVLVRLVDDAGAPGAAIVDAVEHGEGAPLVEEAMLEARERGITATPSWSIDDRLVIPGALPREQIARWVERMRARTR